jgi:hypothetical protein
VRRGLVEKLRELVSTPEAERDWFLKHEPV